MQVEYVTHADLIVKQSKSPCFWMKGMLLPVLLTVVLCMYIEWRINYLLLNYNVY